MRKCYEHVEGTLISFLFGLFGYPENKRKKHKLGLNFLNLNLEIFWIQNLELVDWIVSVIYNMLIFMFDWEKCDRDLKNAETLLS